jgi:hypothetical protein
MSRTAQNLAYVQFCSPPHPGKAAIGAGLLVKMRDLAAKDRKNNEGVEIMRRLLAVVFPIASMKELFKTTFIVLAFVLGTTVAAAAQQDKPGSSNDLLHHGNIAAQNGDFEAAIGYWKKAIRNVIQLLEGKQQCCTALV